MPTFSSFHSNFNHQWESQILKTKKQTHLQSCLIKDCIFTHQKNFFTPILKTVNQLAKHVQTIVHEFTIICDEVCILQNINTIFAKCQKTKKTCLQKKGAFN